LQKNQDRAFAKAMIADLKAKNDANIKFVNFTAKCK